MTLFDIEVIGKSKMGAIAFICTYGTGGQLQFTTDLNVGECPKPEAICELPLASKSESVHTSYTFLAACSELWRLKSNELFCCIVWFYRVGGH